MPKPQFVLTTVGISVLLNLADREWRRRFNQEANARELPDEMAEKAEQIAEQALAILHERNVKRNRELSAELNGLYGLYHGQFPRSGHDIHFLIATDTALGQKAAEVIAQFLRKSGLTVVVYTPPDLSTASRDTFSRGVKALIRQCEETIPKYRDSGYRIIFNLTGAFKSLQGYLNIVGMFYADEIVYIFETGSQLLSIPRLPIRVSTDILREYRVELALMAQGHLYPWEEVGDIPTGLLDLDEAGNATLSDWGLLIWNRVRHELLGDDLLPFPRIQYESSFRKDFKKAHPGERVKLQEALAKVASLLEDHHGDTAALKRDTGLQYDVYAGKTTRDGRPIGHFRISDSRRVSCTVEDGALCLRHYGEHDYVNNNP